jgi:Putative auto-transporter adhesin, head GIN domain
LKIKSVKTFFALVLVGLAAASYAEKGQASEDNTQNQAATEDSNEEKDRGQKATLKLQGEPGTKFQGSCTIGDEESEEISGQVPQSFTYKLKRRPLECEISSGGEVQVDLTVGKKVRSVQQISGGTLNLTYKNGSISSVVSSSSGSSSAVSSSSISSVRGSSSSSGTAAQEPSDTNDEPSSNVTSESREVSGFNEVELKGIGNLSIEQAESESLTVEADEDVIPKIRTEVKNNRLIISPRRNTSINTTEPINYKLTVKDLDALKVSGSGDVKAEGISTDDLAVTISGTGNIKISGKADSQDVEISGSGDYLAEDLESKEAKIDVGGSGSAIVNVSEELEAGVSGSGSVEYVGDPAVKQNVSGAGGVRKQ